MKRFSPGSPPDLASTAPIPRRRFLGGSTALAGAGFGALTSSSTGQDGNYRDGSYRDGNYRKDGNVGEETADTPPRQQTRSSRAEELVRELCASLDARQRRRMLFPLDHPLRHRVENNWHIVEDRVGTLFDRDQQRLVRDIFLNLHSEEYRNEVWEQFVGDNRRRETKTPEEVFGTAAVAVFADEGFEKFEFVLTGRHCTRRCESVSAEGTAAFGGPIFYGHAAGGFYEKPDHPGNAYWFQAERANGLFGMLDGAQRTKALREESRGERGTRTVELDGKAKKKGKSGGTEEREFHGLPVYEMSPDQRKELRAVVADLLLPFREEDRARAGAMIEEQLVDLHLAFYENEDVGGDSVWDTWQLEGPDMIWYFRGDPHVHCWVNVREKGA